MLPAPPSIPSRAEAIAAQVASGGRIAAVLPLHAPRALLRAFGLLPVEVWGPPGIDTSPGDARLQAYTCSIVRSGMAFLLRGGLDVADVVVIPHTCDSLQGLASVLLDFHAGQGSAPGGAPGRQPQGLAPLYLPRDPGPSGAAFLASEIRALWRRLAERYGGGPSDSEIHAAIDREEAADAVLRDLLDSRLRLPWSDRDFYRLVRGREYLPAERFAAAGREALLARTDADLPGRRILLSGMVAEPSTLFDALRCAGAVVAADDLAGSGRRLYPATQAHDPAERMARALLGAAPCPTRGSPVGQRADHLAALASRSGCRAVLFWTVRCCEPELFYLPQVGRELQARGMATVTIEHEITQPMSESALTRIQALVEMAGEVGP